ncbi:MAG: F0F1 ATP synthase subunit B [Maricaulaceae bacterium]
MAAAKGTPFHLDPAFWVAVCVGLFFLVLIWKGAFKSMGQSLDARAKQIEDQLEEARRLREEAQALLASYHRKQKDAETQADDIVRQARSDAEAMATKARKDLSERLERRAAMAEAKIANAEAQALAEVRAKAADIAVDAAQDLLKSKMTATDKSKLIKAGISQMGNLLN